MTLKINPANSKCNCYALVDREIVLKNNSPLNFDDIQTLANYNPNHDIFEETTNNICAMGIFAPLTLPDGFNTKSIREYFAQNSETINSEITRAKALINWRHNNKFCCKCGTKLIESNTFTAHECPECKNIIFPRIDPCIIVLVSKGDKILLARHVQRNQNVYACIAGFIESGESAEHAVYREVLEETGIKVKNIKFVASQSWPFPDQLMLGFTAEYDDGEITLQKDEISDAQWFDKNNCPATPQPGSIAHKLISQAQCNYKK